MLPFCWKEFSEINWHNFSLVAYANLFLVVFCGTFLAYLFNIYGLRILGASIAGAYIYFQPLLASLIAMIFMGESLHIYKLIAAIMIFAGVYLVNRQTQKQL
jgi:drug/metabolite transporter (DMT)-like permease